MEEDPWLERRSSTKLNGLPVNDNGEIGKKVCRLLQCLADVALEYARKVRIDDDSKSLLRKPLKQRFIKKFKDGDKIGIQTFLRGSKDKDSARQTLIE